MRPALLVIVLALGCAPRAGKSTPQNPFPTGRFTDEALRAACPVQVDALRTEWDSRLEGPLPIAGAHPRRVLLDVRERSSEVEVAGLAIDAQAGASTAEAMLEDERGDVDGGRFRTFAVREPIYSGFRGASGFPEVELWLDDESEVTVRVLLRRRVHGGLFESLSYCFESYEYATIEPRTSYARLVIDEPSEGTSDWVALEQY